MKLTDRSINGTSFYNQTIKTTVARLKEALGEPQYKENHGKGKCNYMWDLETKREDVVTVYDWKEYKAIDEHDDIEFHIGGFDLEATLEAKEELEHLLKIRCPFH